METREYVTTAFIILGALAAGVFSAYQYIESVRKQKINDEITDSLAKAQQKLITAQERIDDLQKELIIQVTGSGFPKFMVLPNQYEALTCFVRGSSPYPLFDVGLRIHDMKVIKGCKPEVYDDSVVVAKSCFDSSVIFDQANAMTLKGTLLIGINLNLRKGKHNLTIDMMARNIKTVQYSIIDPDAEIKHSYRIYRISAETHEFEELLEENNASIPESGWEKNFFIQKLLMIDMEQ